MLTNSTAAAAVSLHQTFEYDRTVHLAPRQISLHLLCMPRLLLTEPATF